MEVERQRKTISELELGMYVCELDRPWLETPFLMQGFAIESQQDIQELANYCEFVFIDVAKTRPNFGKIKLKRSSPAPGQQEKLRITRIKQAHLADLLKDRTVRQYHDSVAWNVEVVAAKKAIDGVTTAIRTLFDDIRSGKGLQIAKLKQAVSPLVSSIERNPDACIWLARLKSSDSYIYKHAVATSVWAVALPLTLSSK